MADYVAGQRRDPRYPAPLSAVQLRAMYRRNHTPEVRALLWEIARPLALPGLWRSWPDGSQSFTMLTLNADNHSLMRRMHAPSKEKRSVVIVPRGEWDSWLEVARSFLRLLPAELMDTERAPIPPRPSTKSIPAADSAAT